MNWDISQFHFIRPEWLIALPVVVALWWFIRKASAHQQWRQYFPQPMLEALQVNGAQRSSLWHWCLLISWLTLSFAMAGPTWIKQPVPVVKNQEAVVIILDLSPSMLAEDLAPNRLTRAKFKLIDILSKQEDGQIALIAYAGDAHTVSPLTDDPSTIESLLPALHPDVMPSSGSNIEAAIELAQTLLKDAGISSGDVLVLTGGMTEQAIDNVLDQFSAAHRLSILGVGSAEAAPVKTSTGRLVRKANGDIVLASVNRQGLRSLANKMGGNYSDLRTDDADISYLLNDRFNSNEGEQALTANNTFDAWKDLAHWLVLLVLPLALLCFRKGVIYLFPIIILLPFDSNAAEAGLLDRLFKTKDQQAAELYNDGDFENAAKTFKDSDWSAIAKYRNGDFSNSAEQFSSSEKSITNTYNRANALAMSGQLEQALEAYNQVLSEQTDHADAAHNKEVIEALLKQQQQQQNQQDQNQQSNDDQQQSQDSESSDSQQDQQQSESDQEQQSEQEQQSQSESKQSDEQSQQNEQQQSQSDQQESQENSEQNAESGESEEEQEAQKKEQEQQAQLNEQEESDEQGEEQAAAQAVQAEQTPLKDSSEQWLRTIQDDPSGLLRRKFNYQSQQRQRQGNQDNSQKDRY